MSGTATTDLQKHEIGDADRDDIDDLTVEFDGGDVEAILPEGK